MKKLYSILLLLLLANYVQAQNDLVFEQQFETDITGTPWKASYTSWDATTFSSASHSMKYTRASTQYSLFVGTEVPFVIGQSYNASVRVKTGTLAPGTAGAKIMIQALSGTTALKTVYSIDTRSTDWTQIATSALVVPAGTTSVKVFVFLSTDAIGTAWFDDVKVYKTFIPLDQKFETDITGTPWKTSYTSWDATTSTSPSHSLKYTRASTQYSLFVGTEVPFVIGESYTASVKVKTGNLAPGTAGARIMIQALNGTTALKTAYGAETRSDDWTLLTTTPLIIPAGTTNVKVFVFLSTNAVGTAWFDDVKYFQTPTVPTNLNYDFDVAVPSNFSSSGTPLSLSASHAKNGTNSLQWKVAPGTVLTANNLDITSLETNAYGANNAQFFVYNKKVSNDTLVFRFYDGNVLKREGHMLMNYKGWRDYHRSYRSDYNNGGELPGFNLTKMEILYKPVNPNAVDTLYLDAFTMYGDSKERIPGPYMKLDIAHFPNGDASKMTFFEGINASALICHLQEAGIALPPSPKEISDADTIRKRYQRSIPTPSAANVTAAKNFVTACNISYNADSTIKGRGLIEEIEDPEELVKIANYVGYLAQASIKNNDADAKSKLLLLIEHLLDQGLAEGGRNSIRTNNYTPAQTFPVGFLQSMSLLDPQLKAEVVQMLKWSNQFNVIHYPTTNFVPVNFDYITLKATFLFELATLDPSINNQVRDLKAISKYLSLFTNITQGTSDGIKPDGNGAHHQAPYINYLYAFNTYADRIYSLRGTEYKISQQAYDNLAFAYQTQFLQSSKGKVYANASSGRGSFNPFPINAAGFDKLIKVGGDLIGTAYEPKLAAFYNYIYKTNTYPVSPAQLDGFYHFNYANLGVKRKGDWVVSMKGLTNSLWGSEIYSNANRYGRYQSYGALEVLYKGDSTATGYPSAYGNGWDWRMAPGTTTVHIPFSELQAKVDIAPEYNKKAFAGALSLGQNGVFALDFEENAGSKYTANNLKFHKSVFTFDSLFVCLGSSISATNAISNTATNLFQATSATLNPAIYLNSTTPFSGSSTILSTGSNSTWLVNGQTTGYYVPMGGGDITVGRGTQTTPQQSTKTGTPTATANFSSAYINHGTSPSKAKYQFVMVPGTTPQEMSTLSSRLDSGEIYQVLSQTDTLHAVKYLPTNLTSYAFFNAVDSINVGEVNSISGEALVGIKELGDTLEVTLNNPNLNIVPDSYTDWRSATYHVSLKLNGIYKVVANPNNVGVSEDLINTTLAFSVIDGFSATIKLVANQAPIVSITSPADSANINAAATITIRANATDADGGVSKVEFFNGATKLGEALAAPFAFEWSNVALGVYAITAKATDNNGAVTTSAVVNANVACPPIQLSIPDVYAINPVTDAKNTLYLGYGPASLTIAAQAEGGQGYTYSWSTGATTPATSVSEAGTYSVTVSYNGGCQATASITISLLDVRCGNNNDKVQICHNGKVICVAQAAVQDHLSHGDKLGSCTAAQAGAKNDKLTEKTNSMIDVKAFPNPSTAYFTVKLPNEHNEKTQLRVMDMSGRVVKSITRITGNSVDFGQELQTGVYILEVKDGDKRTVVKLIKL